MIRYDRRLQSLALCLAALAGFVDAAGFVLTQGLFVSFMTGNSTRFAVGVSDNSLIALAAGGLIASFLIGVVIGALIAAISETRRKPAVLAFVTAMLASAAMLHGLGLTIVPAGLLALGMGAINNVFLRDGEVSVGVTYMTGTLVRLGQRIAAAIRGERSGSWARFLLLWASLIVGALAGALLATHGIALCLWLAAILSAALTVAALRLGARVSGRA